MTAGRLVDRLIREGARGARREARPVIARPSRAHFQQSRSYVCYVGGDRPAASSSASFCSSSSVSIGENQTANGEGSACVRDHRYRKSQSNVDTRRCVVCLKTRRIRSISSRDWRNYSTCRYPLARAASQLNFPRGALLSETVEYEMFSYEKLVFHGTLLSVEEI